MRESFPVKLLVRFLESTPEELAAIGRFYWGQRSADWEEGVPAGSRTSHAAPPLPECPPHILAPTDACRYSLRHQRACWLLDFKAGPVQLTPETGLGYAAYLLSEPGELVPSATLFSRFSIGHRKNVVALELPDPETGRLVPLTDGVGTGQLALDKDEAAARSRYRAQLLEYEETIGNPAIPESERAEAQGLYDELVAFLKEHYRPAPDPGKAVTKLVHRSIQRLCDHLREPMAGEEAPDPGAVAFAEYIEEHILIPSRRYTRARPGARVRIARGELAGRLIFECPPGDRWDVKL
jgi:hypothetical protein